MTREFHGFQGGQLFLPELHTIQVASQWKQVCDTTKRARHGRDLTAMNMAIRTKGYGFWDLHGLTISNTSQTSQKTTDVVKR